MVLDEYEFDFLVDGFDVGFLGIDFILVVEG